MKKRIYLLPGVMCNEKLWIKLRPYLDESYELIHLSIPLKSNLDEIVDCLNEIVKEEKIHLIGFSLGGYIASYFACKYPNRIEKLFIISSSLCSLNKEEIEKRKKAIFLVETYGFKGLSRKKVLTLLDDSNKKNEDLIHLIQKMYLDLGKDVFNMQMLGTLYRDDLVEKISMMSFSITYLYSDNDRLVNQYWVQKFSKSSYNTNFVKLESSSHMVPLEIPYELSIEIKNWIN